MKVECPRCGTEAVELIVCEICNKVGCTRCITKQNKQWVCNKCKSGYTAPSPESILSTMFG